jgi:hypothetical protein
VSEQQRYNYSPPPVKKRRPLAVIIVGVFIAIGAIGHFLPQDKTLSDASLRNASDGSTQPSSATVEQSSTSAEPHTVLNISGSGMQTTQKFAVSNDWDLKWSYNCSNFGQKGNFAVMITSKPEAYEEGVNELGESGDGTDHLHGGNGVRYLEINSECSWNVEAVSQ